MFRHRLFASSIKLKIKQFHIVVVRKLQRNVQKKVCYTCEAVVLPTKPIIVVVVVVVCLRCFLTFSLPLRRRIFKSLSIWDATGRRMHLFSTYSSADFSACFPEAKKRTPDRRFIKQVTCLYSLSRLWEVPWVWTRDVKGTVMFEENVKTYLMDLRSSLNRLIESG